MKYAPSIGASMLLLLNVAYSLSCKDFSSTGLPCVEAPECGSGSANIQVTKLSDGSKNSISTSSIDLCYDSQYLRIANSALSQKYFGNVSYSPCNDAIFNLDVSEAFIAPYISGDAAPYCYSEIDLSPGNEIYESGISNPNLNHTGCSNSEYVCSAVDVQHKTVKHRTSWDASLSIPWTLLNCPAGCPKSTYCATDVAVVQKVYRINFYRVNELTPVSKCSSSTCEYMAWSPTFANPPAFHEPKYFGYLVTV